MAGAGHNTVIALGCGNFGGVGSAPEFFGQGIAHDEAFAIMDRAWDAGITWFDTGDAYGGGTSERWIGEWIRARGVRPKLTTKVFHSTTGTPGDEGLAPDRIRRQIHTSLERLGVDRVDYYLAHAQDPDVPLVETVACFESLRGRGPDRRVGAQQPRLRRDSRPPGPRSSRTRSRCSTAPTRRTCCRICPRGGIPYVPFGPLAGGWLTGKYRRGEAYPEGSRMTQRPGGYAHYDDDQVFDALDALSGESASRGVSMAALAFAWVLHRCDGAVCGPNRAKHLDPVLEAMSIELSGEDAASDRRILSMSQVRVLDEEDVRRLLPMADCIDAMAGALRSLARGEVFNPLRPVFRPPNQPSLMGLMPAHRGGAAAWWSLKALTIVPGNSARGLDSHQGFVALFDGESGEPRALMNAGGITAIRTAAVSGVATRLLAREDVRTLAILGSGTQARSHVEAMQAVRNFERIVVWSASGRSLDGAESVETAEEAVRAADVLCTTTASPEPVVQREWLKPGVHINAVGSSIPTARELDSETMAAAALFVDRRESTLNEAGDFLIPQREGLIGPDQIRAELGELLLGTAEGRRSDDEITLFKSLGLGVEDLAAGELVLQRAEAEDAGTVVSL